ncbi:hypothetical protein GCM10020256_63090 [Streptomyces thermocoprophilus]
MALWTGSPVFLSHSTVVSRWLVMPMALMSSRVMPALATAPATTSWTLVQISVALCSTQPRLGEDLLVFLLVDGDDTAVPVEDDAAAGGGALVDGGDERAGGVGVGHCVLLVLGDPCGARLSRRCGGRADPGFRGSVLKRAVLPVF